MIDDDDRHIASSDDARSDEYLWNRRGDVDAEIAHLERVLQPVRYHRRPPVRRTAVLRPTSGIGSAAPRGRFDRVRTQLSMLALAAVLLLLLGVSLLMLRSGAPAGHGNRTTALVRSEPWSVVALRGEPRIDQQPIDDVAVLPAGGWLETDGHSSASVRVADIGTVKLSPSTRLGLVTTSHHEHRMDLQFGRIEAFIVAPQRMFIVDTPLAAAVDLGCQYVLEVDRVDGSALLRVTMGWVAFEQDGRSVQIPRDGMCRTYPGIGAGTPCYVDAPQSIIESLEAFDHEPDDGGPLAVILDEARERDSLTLWHLLDRAAPPLRERIAQRLAELQPPPAGVMIDGVIDGDPAMRRAWLESMPWSIAW